MDGSRQTAITITAADATGKKVCFQDVGNLFATYVDSGLRLPVVQVTGLTPGTGSTAAKVGVGIATTITLTGKQENKCCSVPAKKSGAVRF